MASFHEISLPLRIALGASGGPERLTEVVTLNSGREMRNSRWADSRRRYDIGSGVKSLADLQSVVAFFEERRGRLYGFRFRDRADDRSCAAGQAPSPTDQLIGSGDGATTAFQLAKTYGSAFAPYRRDISKPQAGSLRLAVAGVEQAEAAFTLDPTTGVVTLATPPLVGAAVTAGYLFDVPVRFDADRIAVNLSHFDAGQIPNIPILEIRP